MAKKKVKPNSKITEAKYPIFPNRTKKKKVSKSSNNIKLSIAPWIAGELKIRGLTKDEKEFFEVVSIQKEGKNLVRQFGTQKGADRFHKKFIDYKQKTDKKAYSFLVTPEKELEKLQGRKNAEYVVAIH